MKLSEKLTAIVLGAIVATTALLGACRDNTPKGKVLTPGELQKVEASAAAHFKKTQIINGDSVSGMFDMCEGVDSDGNKFVSCYGKVPVVTNTKNEANPNQAIPQVSYKQQTIYVYIPTGVVALKNPDSKITNP